VRAVTIGADRGLLRSARDRVAVGTLLIRCDHLCPETVLFHDELLTVAGTAGRRDVDVSNARFRIASRQEFVGASVTVDTGRRVTVACLNGFSVEAFFIRGLLIGVAGCATNLFGRGLVRCGLYVCVAIHTGKHAAVNRVLKFVWIDVETDGLAVFLMGQRGVAVTGKALSSRFWRGLFARGLQRAQRQ